MIKGLYTAHTGMVNEMKRLDVLTNNLANADTTAYKKEGTTSRTFADELAIKIKDTSNYGLHQTLGEISLVTHLGQVYTDYSTGSFEVTDNETDFALEGAGFFAVAFTDKGGLILPSVTSVFYIYLLRENFSQIPDELYWAAKVDGTSDLKYLFKVLIPICKPTIVTITILKVIECWNSYVWPRLVTDDQAYFLVSNGIQEIRENGFGRENIPAMMAAVVVITLPLIILFLIFRDKVMEGVSRGGTKG